VSKKIAARQNLMSNFIAYCVIWSCVQFVYLSIGRDIPLAV
jgi:hypothetical protein